LSLLRTVFPRLEHSVSINFKQLHQSCSIQGRFLFEARSFELEPLLQNKHIKCISYKKTFHTTMAQDTEYNIAPPVNFHQHATQYPLEY